MMVFYICQRNQFGALNVVDDFESLAPELADVRLDFRIRNNLSPKDSFLLTEEQLMAEHARTESRASL
jgi:hypothetical protein